MIRSIVGRGNVRFAVRSPGTTGRNTHFLPIIGVLKRKSH